MSSKISTPNMVVAGEIPLLNDCFIVIIDIEDSPSREIPLIELYNLATATINDNNRSIICDAIVQILEDTTWSNPTMMTIFVDAPFRIRIFDIQNDGLAVSLRTTGLQRLVAQSIANRDIPIIDIKNIPILNKLKSPDAALPRPPGTSTLPIESASAFLAGRSGPPSNVSETEMLDQVSELPAPSPALLPQPRIVSTLRTDPSSAGTVHSVMSVPGMEEGGTGAFH